MDICAEYPPLRFHFPLYIYIFKCIKFMNHFLFFSHTSAIFKKGGLCHELQCQQVHRVHRQAVRFPLRRCQLLLSGEDPGGHPRGQPHRGSVHRLQVLPQEITFFGESLLTAAFPGSFLPFLLTTIEINCMIWKKNRETLKKFSVFVL